MFCEAWADKAIGWSSLVKGASFLTAACTELYIGRTVNACETPAPNEIKNATIGIMNGQIVNPSRLMCVPRFVTRCTTCADEPVINAHTTTIADSTATGITNCDNVGTGINQYT